MFRQLKFKIIPLILFIFCITVSSVSAQSVRLEQEKFARLLRLIDSYYVDSANVDKLTEDAIVHILSELDPHSVYISKEEVEKRGIGNVQINYLKEIGFNFKNESYFKDAFTSERLLL